MELETLNKVQEVDRINDTRKAELLDVPIEHIDITKFDARPIIESMGKMSFTSRDLSRATGIYNQMLDKDCSIVLVVAGSTSAGGCMDLYAELVRPTWSTRSSPPAPRSWTWISSKRLATSTTLLNEIPDDDTLRSLYIDRIYDTYIDEQNCRIATSRLARSPTAWSRAPTRAAPSSARWASG